MDVVLEIRAGALLALILATGCAEDEEKKRGNDPTPVPGAGEVEDGDLDLEVEEPKDLIDLDGDGYNSLVDCNDFDAGIHPGAAEVCDGIDQDCDGEADDGVLNTYYADLDLDGVGSEYMAVEACEQPDQYVDIAGDCAPTDPDIGLRHWYPDADGDGFGADGEPITQCDAPDASYVEQKGDCDDDAAAVNPGVPERSGDGVDDDCDGQEDPIAIDGSDLEKAACPAWLPADETGRSLSLLGSDDRNGQLELTIDYDGQLPFGGVDVWLIGFEVTRAVGWAPAQRVWKSTWGVTCETDGLHVVFEQWKDPSEGTDGTSVFPHRPLLLPAEVETFEEFEVAGIGLSPSPLTQLTVDDERVHMLSVAEPETALVDGVEVDALPLSFEVDGLMATILLAPEYGPVYYEDGADLVLEIDAVTER